MAISKETRSYIESLIDYYISEADSYEHIAKSCNSDGSVNDTTIGVIIGCIYSAFLQSCTSHGKSPELDDINDIVLIINTKIPDIKKALDKKH